MKAVQQAVNAIYRSREEVSNAVGSELNDKLLSEIMGNIDVIVVGDPSLTEDELLEG